ncbi:hypothetical protein DMH04_51305 [Kibdelosporangium aridum]|uniref:Uncharacterized protein n=1 Tax=Kibdelosporangium aridum TaxID=2030 RepID=A0A428YA57_KIBAR|nr:hypothetical protein [Kibdelosporangium aridum]RSM64477.1 hypothetical protein DMH04_51305 [Kibdelosporangium aridum]
MSLPPGRGPIPVAGIAPDVDPELAKAAAELNSRVQYLLSPGSHDGPRIYRATGVDDSGNVPPDAEMPQRMPNLDADPLFHTVSVIDGFASDPGALFRSAEAVAGIQEPVIDSAYQKLVTGYFTWQNETYGGTPGRNRPVGSVPHAKYNEECTARGDWAEMKEGWFGPARTNAYLYERDFINYQVYTENLGYIIAENIVRYRAIFQQARADITALMNALTKIFAEHDWYGRGGGLTIDFASVVVSGIATAVTTVLTGGGGAVVAAVTLVDVVGEAIKTAKAEPGNTITVLLQDREYLRDTVKQYLDAVTKVEREAAEAISRLAEALPAKVDEMRVHRDHPTDRGATTQSGRSLPHYRDYF